MVRYPWRISKKSYNKNVKNTKLGKAIKETAGTALGQVYDTGVVQIGNTRHLSGTSIADALKKSKKGIISKLTQLSGLVLSRSWVFGSNLTPKKYPKL